MSDAPTCRYCSRPMQLNTAVSNANVKQFICACIGVITHVNVHSVTKINFKSGERTRTTWPQ